MPLVSHPTTTLNRSQEAQYVYRSVKFLRIKLHPLDAPKSPLQAHHGLTKTRFSSINTVTEFDQAVYQEIRLCPITIPSWCSSHSRQKHPAQAVHFTAPLHSTLHCCVCERNKSDKSWLHATARGTFLFLPQVSRQLWDYASLSGSVAHSAGPASLRPSVSGKHKQAPNQGRNILQTHTFYLLFTETEGGGDVRHFQQPNKQKPFI